MNKLTIGGNKYIIIMKKGGSFQGNATIVTQLRLFFYFFFVGFTFFTIFAHILLNKMITDMLHTYYHKMICLLVLLVTMQLAPTAYCQTQAEMSSVVVRLLDEFNQSPSATKANAFFSALLKEELIDEPLTFTQQTPRDTLCQQVWYWAGEYFYDQQQYQKAEDYAIRALPLCEKGNNVGIHGDCLSLLSLIQIRKGRFEAAARYAKECNKLDMQVGDPDNIASSLNTLAGIYMSMRQPKEAERYVMKGIEYCKKAGNEKRLAVLYGMASEVYHHMEKEEESLDYATRACDIEKKAGREDKVAVRQAQRAAALINLHRYDEAKKALEEAIPEFRRDGNRHSLGIACNQMGLLLHREKNDSAAVGYLNEALAIFQEQNDLFNESQSHKSLYNVLRLSNPELAMQHIDRYEELRDSLYDRNTGELLSKYAAEYGNAELLQQQEEEHNAHTRDILIAVLVLLALLLGVWIFRSIERRRYQRRMETLLQKIDLLSKQNERTQDSQEHDVEDAEKTRQEEETIEDQDQQFLAKVIAEVEKALSNKDYSVESIAEQMNMSVSTFRRRLMSITGESPKNYITAIQMNKAATLLEKQSGLSVNEVSSSCGFDDAANFSRVFKRFYGVAPSQYSKKKEEHLNALRQSDDEQ